MGRKLLGGASSVTIDGRRVDVHASMAYTDVFSGHADHNGLMNFVRSQHPQQLKKLFLTHGDYEAMLAFQASLEAEGYQVTLPFQGQMFEL
jgi:metallo-beta-lactamase family protein